MRTIAVAIEVTEEPDGSLTPHPTADSMAAGIQLAVEHGGAGIVRIEPHYYGGFNYLIGVKPRAEGAETLLFLIHLREVS